MGCAPRWPKYGEGHPFLFGPQRRLNSHGNGYENARLLLVPDAVGNAVYKISIMRGDSENEHVLIHREFRYTLRADIFWANLSLSENVGNVGFHDLCDFFCLLEQLWIFYTNNDVFVKSYDVSRSRLKYVFEENDCHPLLITECCCRENIWWEDIWQEEMLGHRHPERNGGYFWPDDRQIIDRIMAHLKTWDRLMGNEDLEILTRFAQGDGENRLCHWLPTVTESQV